ncbi:MAG: PAS domain S-box protein [Opitutales bacterium]|nr:PAS domain S-box protein [Opitutales bacterium]
MPILSKLSSRTLFEIGQDAIFIADAKSGTILEANRNAQQLCGAELHELQKRQLVDLHSPSSREQLRARIDERRPPDDDDPEILEIENSSGFTAVCEVQLHWVEQQDQCFLIEIARDVTERVRASEEINLRNVAIASFSGGVTIADARQPDLPLIYINRGFEELTGFKAKDAIGRSCRFLQGADRNQEGLDTLRAALKAGESCVVRLRNYRKDGSLFHNELHLSPVRNEQGELTHFVGLQIDVSERVRNRDLITRSERRYRLLTDSIEDLITRRTQDGLLEFVSSAAETMLGLQPEEWVGKDYLECVHPDDRKACAHQAQRIFETGEASTMRLRLRHADGEYVWIESRESLGEPLEDGSEPLLVSVSRDITRQKQAEEEVRQALEKERELNEIKTRFISMVSHEFRTPMTSIKASTTLLRDFGDRLPEEKKLRHHQNIASALKRMNQMLDDVLFVGRSESGHVRFSPKPLKIHAYCQELIESLELPGDSPRIAFHSELAEDARFALDENLLNHIFQNLLGNALKYSGAEKQVLFSVSRNDDALEFNIRDEGIGIPEAARKRLFEAFYRAANVGVTQGTGLGLSIAQRSIALHGGSLHYSSEEGVGTTFTVRLPITNPSGSKPNQLKI